MIYLIKLVFVGSIVPSKPISGLMDIDDFEHGG